MALELSLIIQNNATAKTGIVYESKTATGLVFATIDTGVVDVAIDGQVNIPMAGKGVLLGDNVKTFFNDFDGSNYSTTLDAAGWSIVSDDGVAPPAVLKLLAAGDSQTDRGGTGDTDGNRPANQYVGVTQEGYWGAATLILSEHDYIYRHHMGKSGDTVSGMITRVAAIRAKDIDLLVLSIGTNDSNKTLGAVNADFTQLITDLRADGLFEILIVPVPHRNDVADPTSRNAFIDDLNAHAITVAAATDGVEIGAIPTLFNAAIMTDQVTYGGVSDDGLHSNEAGAMMWAAESLVPALNTYYPSTIENKFNLLPSEFPLSGGALSGGGTGVTPLGTIGYWASPNTGSGYTPVTIADKVWVEIKTNGGVPASSNNRGKLRYFPTVPCTEGWYVAELRVIFDNPELVSEFELYLNSEGATYSYTELTKPGNVSVSFDAGVEYVLRTPSCRLETDNFEALFQVTQEQGVDAVCRVTDFKVYKVEEV